ncbi:hypothetical protein TetV_006 [Tetraselmis virus 1]|uniref:Uncharacterized protein n=1 Tax=Tetraselmis virus 1 TaxID=2060617 RepID=A0A2P0VMI2_9VIRU|nr:hypothetical protein QJ968_gp006 [Tetraselmis virus 1]AUF82098.1 hypothetical protein TetV_006 [Tetraselmis virus 1]
MASQLDTYFRRAFDEYMPHCEILQLKTALHAPYKLIVVAPSTIINNQRKTTHIIVKNYYYVSSFDISEQIYVSIADVRAGLKDVCTLEDYAFDEFIKILEHWAAIFKKNTEKSAATRIQRVYRKYMAKKKLNATPVKPVFNFGSTKPEFNFGSTKPVFNFGSTKPAFNFGFPSPTRSVFSFNEPLVDINKIRNNTTKRDQTKPVTEKSYKILRVTDKGVKVVIFYFKLFVTWKFAIKKGIFYDNLDDDNLYKMFIDDYVHNNIEFYDTNDTSLPDVLNMK